MAFSKLLDSNIAQTIFLPTFIKIATCIGYIYIASKITNFVLLLLDLFLLRGKDLRKYGKKGSWAVITGASDDLGKEYAFQLAAKGFNTLLISPTESKLQTLAQEIESRHADIRTKTLVIDFAQNSDADYTKLKRVVDGLDIAILINNVDRSHSIPVPFILAPEDEIEDIITINCMATLRVTRIIAPGMVLRHRGVILTMGCFDGLSPTPLLGTYSGSKAFLQHWSTALGAELKPEGVEVQLVLSYNMVSATPKVRKSSMMIPTPRVFVETVLRKIGRAGGAQSMGWTMTPYWTHALMQWGLENLPKESSEILVGMKMSFNEKIRKRALKKMEMEGKKID